jgi:hypothetical protein
MMTLTFWAWASGVIVCVFAADCPSGWLPASGTVYDSWPKPGSVECVRYSGCRWAGQFSRLPAGSGRTCEPGALYMDGGDGSMACRWPPAKVREMSVAATYQRAPALLGKRLEVAVSGRPAAVVVNVSDVCADR